MVKLFVFNNKLNTVIIIELLKIIILGAILNLAK